MKKTSYTEADELLVYKSLDAKQNRTYQNRYRVVRSCAKVFTEFFGEHWFKRDGSPKGNKPVSLREIKQRWKRIKSKRRHSISRRK